MADKTRNININYNIRTVGVDQSRAAVASVEQATKNLQQSAPIAGQRISTAFQQSTQSVLSMKMQLDRLKTSLELATNPAKIAQLSAQYKTLKAQIDATNKSLFEQNKAVKEVTTNTKSLTAGFTGLYSAIKTVIAAGLIREVASVAIEMAKLNGNTEGVERAFNRAFPDSKSLISELTRATHGAVTEFELMQKTLQATNLGVSASRLGVLFEFAAARAQQTGESVDYLTNSIVTGIGRKSIRVIDNLGISAIALKKELGGVSAATASVGEVTEAVARVAQRELQKMGGYAETSATKVDQLTVSWHNLRVELSKRFEESGFVSQLTELVDSYQAAAEAQRRGITVQELFEERQRQEIAQMGVRVSLQFALTGEREKDIKVIEDQIVALTKNIGAWAKYRDVQNDLIREQREEREALVLGTDGIVMTGRERQKQIKILEDQIALNIRLRDSNKENVLIDQESLKILQGKLLALQKDNAAEIESLGIIEEKRNQIEAINEAIEKTRNASDLSSRLQVGKLITDLAVAQAELKELLEGPANTEFKVKFEVEKLSLPSDKSKVLSDFEKEVKDLLKSVGTTPIPVPIKPVIITPTTFGDQILEEVQKNQENIISSGFDILSDQLNATEEAEVASLQNRLNNVRNYYDEQELLAGDNERAKAELRLREERETAALQKKIAEKERQARRFSIIIDTATGIMRAFATLPTPAAIVQSAVIAALGASQLAIVSRTPARFAKGVLDLKGPGSETSDSIPALLSKGESVMTAKETRRSFGLLEAIKDNRIDDRILRNLQLTNTGVKVVPWNNKPVVDAINGNKHPDIITVGRQMYKVFKDRDGNKRYIRSKSM